MAAKTRRSAIGWPIGRTRHTASPGRRSLRWPQHLTALIVVACPLGLALYATSNSHTITTAFALTRGPASYPAPPDVCRTRIEANGASGGESGTAETPDAGARATALFPVTLGETLHIRVGGEDGAAAGVVRIGTGFGWATISYDRETNGCRTSPRKRDPAASARRDRSYTTLQMGELPEQWNSGTSGQTAQAAHPAPAKPSPAAVTAYYRRAAERTARLMGKPAPKWKVCPSCKLAFHGPDTVPENPATGHTPGDWQP